MPSFMQTGRRYLAGISLPYMAELPTCTSGRLLRIAVLPKRQHRAVSRPQASTLVAGAWAITTLGPANVTGCSLSVNGGKVRGTPPVELFYLQTSPAGPSGSTQNALVTRMSIDSTGNINVPGFASAAASPYIYPDSSGNLHVGSGAIGQPDSDGSNWAGWTHRSDRSGWLFHADQCFYVSVHMRIGELYRTGGKRHCIFMT